MSVNCCHAWKSGHITCLGSQKMSSHDVIFLFNKATFFLSDTQGCYRLHYNAVQHWSHCYLFWERADQCFIGKCWLQHSTGNTVNLMLCILVIAWTGHHCLNVSPLILKAFFHSQVNLSKWNLANFYQIGKNVQQHILSTRPWGHFKQSRLKKQLVSWQAAHFLHKSLVLTD